MPYKVGFIGGGNMSSAIFKGIIKKDGHPISDIWVSGPHLENLKHWQELGAHATVDNKELFSQCDVVFLGIKPNMLQDVVRELVGSVINQPKLVISMLAGVTLEKLDKTFYHYFSIFHNKIQIARIMPNVAMAIGSGLCLVTCSENVTVEHKQRMMNLLNCCGNIEEIYESLMDSLGVLTACGPAFMFIVMEALADGAVAAGAGRAAAQRAAAHAARGAAQLLLAQAGAKHPAQLKDEVCSPGGSTIAGVSALEEGRLRSTLIKAVEASTKRTKELSSQAASEELHKRQ